MTDIRANHRMELLRAYDEAIEQHYRHEREALSYLRTAEQYAAAFEREGFDWPEE